MENEKEIQEEVQSAQPEKPVKKKKEKGEGKAVAIAAAGSTVAITGSTIAVIIASTVAVIALVVLLIGVILSSMGLLAISGSGITWGKTDATEPAITEPIVTQAPTEAPATPAAPDHSYTVDDATAAAKAGEVVATAGEAKLTNAQLQVYYENNIYAYQSQYGYYLMMMGIDLSQSLDTMYYDEEANQTWQDIMLDSALQNWHIYAAVRQYAEAEGFALDEEGQAYIAGLNDIIQEMVTASNCETPEQMVTEQIAPGATVDAFRKHMEDDYFYSRYLEYLGEKFKPSDGEIETYYADNEATLKEQGISKDSGDVVDVRHVLIMPEGGTTDENNQKVYSEAEWEACRVKAQALYDAWMNGEATEETFIQMAKDNSQDGNASTGGIYEGVPKGYMVAEFEEWIFEESREYGHHGLVKTQFGYHIMFFVDRHAEWTVKTSQYMVNESIDAVMKAAMEAYPLEKNLEAVVLSR